MTVLNFPRPGIGPAPNFDELNCDDRNRIMFIAMNLVNLTNMGCSPKAREIGNSILGALKEHWPHAFDDDDHPSIA